MKLLLHLLMLVFLSGGSARVVQDFEQSCGQFFANKTSPTKFPGTQYKQICQTLNGVSYYATYYDTNNKIPVYSAYKFNRINKWERADSWYIEPQLDVDRPLPNMDLEKNVEIQNLGDNQALNKDYENSGYNRGHLAPVYHASSQQFAYATFTLTNAAPQNPSFNQGKWRVLEKNIAIILGWECKVYTPYIVTGVVPGTTAIKNRVNVPSHFWTSFCCLDNNKKCQLSKGFIGKNENTFPKELNVTDLEKELARLYKVNLFVLFDNK